MSEVDIYNPDEIIKEVEEQEEIAEYINEFDEINDVILEEIAKEEEEKERGE